MSIFTDSDSFLNESKRNYLTFIEFLKEANHGIYNKDPRLKEIVSNIKESIGISFKKLNGSKFENLSGIVEDFSLITQPPNIKTKIEIDFEWQIIKDDKEPEFRKKFFDQAVSFYNPIFQKATLIISLVKGEVQTKGDFYQEVNSFIRNDLNEVLYHEVKHLLDRIDLRNRNKKIPKLKDLNYETGKYQSQDKEIYNFLLTLIGEFEKIENKNPGITFTGVIKQSKWYHKILDSMKVDKRNTLKGKLVDFWIDNYGMDRLK